MLLMLQLCDEQFVGWHVCVYTFCLHIYFMEMSQPSYKIFKTVPNDIFVQLMNLGEILEGLVYFYQIYTIQCDNGSFCVQSREIVLA